MACCSLLDGGFEQKRIEAIATESEGRLGERAMFLRGREVQRQAADNGGTLRQERIPDLQTLEYWRDFGGQVFAAHLVSRQPRLLPDFDGCTPLKGG